jgi:hypothetical protein
MGMNNKRLYVIALVAVSLLAIAGCKKKDAVTKEIELPQGQIHLGAQWVDGALWVESFDPKSATCTFSEYYAGKIVEETTITFKNCRTGLGGPMVRPALQGGMPGRPGVNRPVMNNRPEGGQPQAIQPQSTAPAVAPAGNSGKPAASQPVAPVPKG